MVYSLGHYLTSKLKQAFWIYSAANQNLIISSIHMLTFLNSNDLLRSHDFPRDYS